MASYTTVALPIFLDRPNSLSCVDISDAIASKRSRNSCRIRSITVAAYLSFGLLADLGITSA